MRAEHGFSLIEVMVALLLVSMVFLGFLAVQLKAHVATKDAVMRTQAVMVLNAQAERLRGADTSAYRAHQAFLNQLNRNVTGSSAQMLSTYQKGLVAFNDECTRHACDQVALAKHHAYHGAVLASNQGLRLNALPCDQKHCLVVAWANTPATQASDGCLNQDGAINQGASCMMMAY